SSSTDWFIGTNWAPAGTPGSNDSVFIMSGTVIANGPITVSGLNVSGGAISLSGLSTVTILTWTAGTIQGAGTLTVPTEGSVTLGGSANKILRAQSINSFGSIVLNGSGPVLGDSGA